MQITLLAFDWFFLIEKLVLIIGIISVSLVIAMYETWAERKVAAFIQDRIGPNRAGPLGLFQPLADGYEAVHERRDHSQYFQQDALHSRSLSRDAHCYDDLRSDPLGRYPRFLWKSCSTSDHRHQHRYPLRFRRGEYGCLWYHDRRLGIQQ